jgi:ribosomal-protein-alanine N-acetyltransferase
LASLVRYANNRRVWIHLRDRLPHPYTEADGIAWIEYATNTTPVTNLAIEYQGEAIGSIGLTLQDDIETGTAEVGYWLGEPFWGRGLATTALRAFCQWGFIHFALRRFYAGVMKDHASSRRVLEKVGFVLEGVHRQHVCKAGKVQDQAYYGLLCGELR